MSWTHNGRRLAVTLAAAGAALAAVAASAQADIYWTNEGTNSIGRASLCGENPNQNFITGAFDPQQITIAGHDLYWANAESPSRFREGYVARARLNGAGVNQTFADTGIQEDEGPFGVAVSSSHIYWSTTAESDFDLIGRSNIDGSNPDQSFAPDDVAGGGLAIYGRFLYFATGFNEIGRIGLDGTHLDANFITLRDGVFTQTVAVDRHYIYWTELGGQIGRDTLNGNPANINESFITGAHAPVGLALGCGYIYWTNFGGNSIGRDTIDGNPADVDQNFITGASRPVGVAVN